MCVFYFFTTQFIFIPSLETNFSNCLIFLCLYKMLTLTLSVSLAGAYYFTNPNNIFIIYCKKSPLVPVPIFSCIYVYIFTCIF